MKKTFAGFPRDGLAFLAELAQNNEKEWFEGQRERYETELLQPAVAFVTAVGEALRGFYPDIGYDTRTNGSGSLMRIYRDTRFSKDKTPYKTNISGMFWHGDGRKTESPGFGFQLNNEGLGLMGGMFGFSKEQLGRYRTAVLDDELGPQLARAAGQVLATGVYDLEGQEYKKVPRGFDPDHPRAEWLKYKGLWVRLRHSIPLEMVYKPEIVDQVVAHFRTMAPIQQWLVTALATDS